MASLVPVIPVLRGPETEGSSGPPFAGELLATGFSGMGITLQLCDLLLSSEGPQLQTQSHRWPKLIVVDQKTGGLDMNEEEIFMGWGVRVRVRAARMQNYYLGWLNKKPRSASSTPFSPTTT